MEESSVVFSKEDYKTLTNILRERRDVRGNLFTSKKIPKKELFKILHSATLAPSVGYSQPWEFKIIDDSDTKNKVYKEFESSYEKSKKRFKDKPLYSKLKLEGIKEAPLNIAIFYKKPDSEILGQTYMKKSGEYSVVCAALNMWLTARSLNIGMGWVSIFKPKKIKKILNIKKEHKLVAYFCVGYVKEFYNEPELKKLKWEKKKGLKKCLMK